QRRKRVAEAEAAAAAMTDVEHPLELLVERGLVVELRVAPVERMARRGLQAAFAPGFRRLRCRSWYRAWCAHVSASSLGSRAAAARLQMLVLVTGYAPTTRRAGLERAPAAGECVAAVNALEGIQGLLETIGMRALGLGQRLEPIGDFGKA